MLNDRHLVRRSNALLGAVGVLCLHCRRLRQRSLLLLALMQQPTANNMMAEVTMSMAKPALFVFFEITRFVGHGVVQPDL